jgi:hypothetical protein
MLAVIEWIDALETGFVIEAWEDLGPIAFDAPGLESRGESPTLPEQLTPRPAAG